MLAAIVGVVGYLNADAGLGIGLIKAFDWILTYYWITSSILGVIVVGLFLILAFGGTVVGSEALSKFKFKGSLLGGMLGAGIGSLAGAAIAVVFLFRAFVLIYCAGYLVDNIDPNLTTFDDVSSQQWMAFAVIAIVHIIAMASSSSSSNSK